MNNINTGNYSNYSLGTVQEKFGAGVLKSSLGMQKKEASMILDMLKEAGKESGIGNKIDVLA